VLGEVRKKLLRGNDIEKFCGWKSTASKYFHEKMSDGHVSDLKIARVASNGMEKYERPQLVALKCAN
jgi:hypothetical protein